MILTVTAEDQTTCTTKLFYRLNQKRPTSTLFFSSLESVMSSFCITQIFKVFTKGDNLVLMKSIRVEEFFNKSS